MHLGELKIGRSALVKRWLAASGPPENSELTKIALQPSRELASKNRRTPGGEPSEDLRQRLGVKETARVSGSVVNTGDGDDGSSRE